MTAVAVGVREAITEVEPATGAVVEVNPRLAPWRMWCCAKTAYLPVRGAEMDRKFNSEKRGMTMFLVSGKSEESVIVDGFNSSMRALKVTVLEINDRRIRFGVDVNAGAPVHRLEVWERIRASGRPSPHDRRCMTA